uniref:Uncharacterized protein n=1 Tax=Mustela putorius furo TaxID=9669 RepID=M3Z5Q0_MUSPF
MEEQLPLAHYPLSWEILGTSNKGQLGTPDGRWGALGCVPGSGKDAVRIGLTAEGPCQQAGPGPCTGPLGDGRGTERPAAQQGRPGWVEAPVHGPARDGSGRTGMGLPIVPQFLARCPKSRVPVTKRNLPGAAPGLCGSWGPASGTSPISANSWLGPHVTPKGPSQGPHVQGVVKGDLVNQTPSGCTPKGGGCPCHGLRGAAPPPGCVLTVDLVQRDLPEDLQVGPVEHAAEDPLQAPVVGVQQRLRGHAVGHKPHAQEEEEEEDVLYLQGRSGEVSGHPLGLQSQPPREPGQPRYGQGLTMRSTMMILGPSCLWTAKMWMSRSVNTMKSTARTVRPASNIEGTILGEGVGWKGC